MIYVGIDNGVSGAMAAVPNGPSVQIIAAIANPIQKGRKAPEIDICGAYEWILALTDGKPSTATFIIEEPGGSKSAKAASSMAGSFHAYRSMFEILKLRYHRITPQSWQKVMLPGCDAGDTKPAALSKARQLWPEENWLRTPSCKKPHDGLIDAALIAEYGRIKNL